MKVIKEFAVSLLFIYVISIPQLQQPFCVTRDSTENSPSLIHAWLGITKCNISTGPLIPKENFPLIVLNESSHQIHL